MHDSGYGFPRIHLLGTWMNKGIKKGRVPLAPALGSRPSSQLSTSKRLKEADFVPLHARYRPPAGLRRLLAHPVGRFLRGAHGLFALPEGYPEHLATVALTQGAQPFEPVQLPSTWEDLLSCLVQTFI
jgi:hypothetical protein